MQVACHKADDPDQSNLEPGESLILPCTPLYGTVRVDAWRGVHPVIHGDYGYFVSWGGAREATAREEAEELRGRTAVSATLFRCLRSAAG